MPELRVLIPSLSAWSESPDPKAYSDDKQKASDTNVVNGTTKGAVTPVKNQRSPREDCPDEKPCETTLGLVCTSFFAPTKVGGARSLLDAHQVELEMVVPGPFLVPER